MRTQTWVEHIDWLATWLELTRWIRSSILKACRSQQVEGASLQCCSLPRTHTLDSLTDLAISSLEREQTSTFLLHPASPRGEPESVRTGHARPAAAESLQCRGRGVCFYCEEATHITAQCPTCPQTWEVRLTRECIVDKPKRVTNSLINLLYIRCYYIIQTVGLFFKHTFTQDQWGTQELNSHTLPVHLQALNGQTSRGRSYHPTHCIPLLSLVTVSYARRISHFWIQPHPCTRLFLNPLGHKKMIL